MTRVILVTGGMGFIGSNLVRRILETRDDATVVNLDALTYAGNAENLADLEENDRHVFVKGDICDREAVDSLLDSNGVTHVMHLAAESHVDRSILGAEAFVRTNVMGTQVLLDACRSAGIERFLHCSTDEVYGDLGEAGGLFREDTPLAPNSPYSASKAASDMLVRAAHHTHGMDVVTTRCSNNYGPYQFPEKLIPLMIANALEGAALPIYGDGKNIRDWLYVVDHADALLCVLENGAAGRVYNIGGNCEQENLAIVRAILDAVGASDDLIEFVEDRLGHDRRYAIDASRIREELGWEPGFTFEEALPATVEWYVSNREWWERVRSGEYRDYYERQYGTR